MLAASIDALIELAAGMLVSGLVWRRQREVPLEFFDAGTALVAFALLAWLVVRAIRHEERDYAGWGTTYRLPPGSDAPTTSWAHFLWSACWLYLGVGLWELFGAFAVLGVCLVIFRASMLVWRRR